jgi:hypothetical protein
MKVGSYRQPKQNSLLKENVGRCKEIAKLTSNLAGNIGKCRLIINIRRA